MPKAIDITNKRFGKLVAISKEPSRSGHTYWKCKCDCGNEKIVQTSHLKSGKIFSCGCIDKTKNFSKGKKIKEKTCVLCKKTFIPNVYRRVYCYDCLPTGLSDSEILKTKKRRVKHFLVEYKGGKCEICGYNKCEGALQFHHKDPSEKDFTLSQINLNDSLYSIDVLYEEVDKCMLLCANCHAEQHYTN